MKKLQTWAKSLSMALTLTLMQTTAFASLDWTTPPALTATMNFLGQAMEFLGIGIILFGALQIAFAFRSDDAEGKSKGLRAAVAGAMVYMVGVGVGMFIT